MKNCLNCGKLTQKANQANYCSSCRKERHRASVRKWNDNHPEVLDRAAKKYRRKHPERIKAQNRERAEYKRERHLRRYSITPTEWDDLFNKQGRVCAICGCKQPIRAWNTDHNHKTGTVRGILCESCNILLGMAHDDISVLTTAIDYLSNTN